jgi:hypothetical protein
VLLLTDRAPPARAQLRRHQPHLPRQGYPVARPRDGRPRSRACAARLRDTSCASSGGVPGASAPADPHVGSAVYPGGVQYA